MLGRLRGMEKSYAIRPVMEADAEAVSGVMAEVQQGVMHSRDDASRWSDGDRADVHDFFLISDPDRVRNKLRNPDGFGYVVEGSDGGDKPCVVGYYLFEKLPVELEGGIARQAGLAGEELAHVAEMDSVAVLPAWRGLGLQRKLEALGEREAVRRGCRHLVATVHPRNHHSLDNFLASGFRVVARVVDDVPADRVLHDDPLPGEPMMPVERYVVRKDL